MRAVCVICLAACALRAYRRWHVDAVVVVVVGAQRRRRRWLVAACARARDTNRAHTQISSGYRVPIAVVRGAWHHRSNACAPSRVNASAQRVAPPPPPLPPTTSPASASQRGGHYDNNIDARRRRKCVRNLCILYVQHMHNIVARELITNVRSDTKHPFVSVVRAAVACIVGR